MYPVDHASHTWTASPDAAELLWNNTASVSELSPQDASNLSSLSPLRTSSEKPLDSSVAWELAPNAPTELRNEVLDLFSTVERIPPMAKLQSIRSAPSIEMTTSADIRKASGKSASSRGRSQPATAEQKQANARESQKRFRMRQKVCTYLG